jgi:hypothetical protein
MGDAIDELIDVVEHGGSADRQADVVTQARAAQQA